MWKSRRFAVALDASCPRRFVPGLIVVASAIAITLNESGSRALATSGTWSSSATTGLWSSPSNWVPATAPGATSGTTNTDTATFNSNSSFTSITTDAGRNLENITFDTSAATYAIGTTGGPALQLTSGGTIQIAGTFTGANIFETINAPLTLDGSYTFADNSTNAGVGLDFGGAVTSGVAGTQTLTIAGAGTTTTALPPAFLSPARISKSAASTARARRKSTPAAT
jgi:hypothetical protein